MIKNETSLEKCRQLIEASLHWGDVAAWTNEDFEELSDKIFERTDVRLSVSTLKRIWGKVRYESSPTGATLNALARFAGFAGWREFLQQYPERPVAGNEGAGKQSGTAALVSGGVMSESVLTGPEDFSLEHPAAPGQTVTGDGQKVLSGFVDRPASAVSGKVGRRRPLFLTSIIVSTVVILIGLISLFGLRLHSGSAPQQAADLSRLKFETKKTSEDLPNSVVFYYDASSLDAHEVILQQSWDTTRREIIPTIGKEYTSLYYYPGYFVAKLIVDGVIRKECPVFIKTKGWKGIIVRKPLPVYLGADEMGSGSSEGVVPGPGGKTPAEEKGLSLAGIDHPVTLGISAAVLQKKTGAALFNDTWVDFTNVRQFDDIPADHFTLSTTLRNTSTVEQCLCRKIKITVLGTESAIIIPLSDKGCISDLFLLTGDRGVNGKDNDLSAFGCDFKDFQRVKCIVEDHQLKIMLNDKLIYTTEQRQSIGEIMGIRISFEGAGEIREVTLQGPARNIFLVGSGRE